MFTNEEKKQFQHCTAEDQHEIFKAFLDGRTHYYDPVSREWEFATIINPTAIYRVVPPKEEYSEGITPIKGIPWEVIDSKWNWAAMDGGGDLYLFEEIPTMDTVCHCWCTSEDCRFIDDIFKIDLSEVNWHTSLTKRPEYC